MIIPTYNNNINKSINNHYNYQPSKYNSLLQNKELGPDDKKIFEKYKNYRNYNDNSYKNQLTYDYNNDVYDPCYLYFKYKYNPLCDYPLSDEYDLGKKSYLERNNYPSNLNYSYTYCVQSPRGLYDYNFKKTYPENLLHNTKFENYHVPSSQSNYNSQIQ